MLIISTRLFVVQCIPFMIDIYSCSIIFFSFAGGLITQSKGSWCLDVIFLHYMINYVSFHRIWTPKHYAIINSKLRYRLGFNLYAGDNSLNGILENLFCWPRPENLLFTPRMEKLLFRSRRKTYFSGPGREIYFSGPGRETFRTFYSSYCYL